VDDDLQYLVHFFNDERHLFETITMAGAADRDRICDAISARRGWFWVRFSPSERQGYLRRRLFVEKALYDDYRREHGPLKERVPVFFYLIPRVTEQEALRLARQRTSQGEAEARVLMAKRADLDDTSNMTFTLNDSHTAYWRTMKEAGMDFGGEAGVPDVLEDHDRVFPFAMIDEIHGKYRALGLPYEVQVWDRGVLERLRYSVLGAPAVGIRRDDPA
jgi:hypothetical protein